MNNFDQTFFSKYLPDWVNVITIIHKHFLLIFWKIILNYFFWVIVPAFLYYYSKQIRDLIPFFVLEIFLLLMFLKILYDIFNWYNDVWIVTQDWVTQLDWELLSTNSVSVKYKSIEWIELVQNWLIDNILWIWDLVIHKIWWENFVLTWASNVYNSIDIIDKNSKKIKKDEDEKNKNNDPQNFETVVKALSWVVEEYLWKSWYKKDNSEEKKQLIEKIKKIEWTIDLSK